MNPLFRGNPMMAEVSRMNRTLFSTGRSSSSSMTIAVLVLLLVLGLFASGILPLSAAIGIQMTAVVLMAPLYTFRQIAAERENRSLDFLAVAPLTAGQIVAGKFLASLVPQAALMAIGLFCNIIISLRPFETAASFAMETAPIPSTRFAAYLLGAVMLVAVSLFTTSMVLFISSRAKRAIGALGIAIAATAVFYLGIPMLLGFMTMGAEEGQTLIRLWSPFMNLDTLHHLAYPNSWSAQNQPDQSGVLAINLVGMGVVTVLFLIGAARSLRRDLNLGGFLS